MQWTVTSSQDEQEWFADYVAIALASPAPRLPSRSQRIGAATVTWFETEPGVAFIQASEGSVDDRILATHVLREALKGHGIKRAQYNFDQEEEFRKTADWDDVAAKAKRLIQSGQVQLLRNGANNVVGHVVGDHGEYQTEIGRDDPNSRAITTWQCDCPWDQYAWQRTRQWKKYEGRPCAHVLATYWKALATPLDEDMHPANGGQQSLFNMPQQAPPMGAPSPYAAPQPMPQQQMPIPGMFPGQATGTPPMPSDSGIIPPFPMDQMQMEQVNPASVPGLRQPSPTNPIQYPGGTFSKITDNWDFDPQRYAADFNQQDPGFLNGNMVSTKTDDWGIWQGKSEEHGAGTRAKIPAGSVGEVLGQDPSTGMVQVLFSGKIAEQHGPMMPYGATAWFFPGELLERPDVRRPGPAIRRR